MKKTNKTLKNILDSYSSSELQEDEVKSLHERLDSITLCKQYLQDFKESPASSDEIFMNTVIAFMEKTLQLKEDEFHQIMLIYFLLISSYITDFFNTDGLKEKKKHIKKIKKLFYDATENVVKTYEFALLETINRITEGK